MGRHAFARGRVPRFERTGRMGFGPPWAFRSPESYGRPLAAPPIVNSSCLWIFTIASGRTMTEGTFERRRTPVFALASRAAARNSLARCGLRSERSAVKSIVVVLRSRAGIGRNRSVDECGGPRRCRRYPIEGFLLVVSPDNGLVRRLPTLYYPTLIFRRRPDAGTPESGCVKALDGGRSRRPRSVRVRRRTVHHRRHGRVPHLRHETLPVRLPVQA